MASNEAADSDPEWDTVSINYVDGNVQFRVDDDGENGIFIHVRAPRLTVFSEDLNLPARNDPRFNEYLGNLQKIVNGATSGRTYTTPSSNVVTSQDANKKPVVCFCVKIHCDQGHADMTYTLTPEDSDSFIRLLQERIDARFEMS